LNNIAASLQNALSEIQNFISNRNEAHLGSATDHIDNALVQTGSLPPLPTRAEAEALLKALVETSERLNELEIAVRHRLNELLTDMDAQKQALEPIRQQLESFRQQAEAKAQEVVAYADQRIAEIKVEIDAHKARLDEVILQHQAQFAEAQERRLQEFNDGQKQREAAFSQRSENLLAAGQAQVDELLAKARGMVTSLEEQEERARQIVGVTAASGAAGSYVKEATEQRQEADTWRRVAVALGLLLLAGAFVSGIVSPPSGNMSVGEAVSFFSVRLSVGGALGGVIYFIISQSDEHRRRERSAKRLADQLTAFRPFLAELNDAERNILISEAWRRFFPGDDAPSPPPV
jgi:hypothetical protein